MNFARRLSEQRNRLQSNAQQALRRLPVVLSEQQIEQLKAHRYASEGTTLFDPYMQHFWKWLVEFFPLWIAPNLITLVGVTINIATSVLLMILTDGAKEQVKCSFRIEQSSSSTVRFSVHGGCTF